MDDGRKTENQQKEFAAEMKKLMEIAALENYTSLSSCVQGTGTSAIDFTFEKVSNYYCIIMQLVRF